MHDPIWAILKAQGRHKRWLAEQIGYSHGFVRLVACGVRPASAEFRRRCAKALSLPESVLFAQAAEASVSGPETTNRQRRNR